MLGSLQGTQANPQAPLGGMGNMGNMGQQFQGSPSQPYNQGLYNTALNALGPSAAGKATTPGLYGPSQGLYSTLQQLAAIGLIGQTAPPNLAQTGTTPTGPWANAGGEGGGGGGGGAEGTM